MKIELKNYTSLIFDFDGVFTNNKVYVDQNGLESIRFSRADGYGINLLALSKAKKLHNLDYFVLSSEKNSIVSYRCEKMNINCIQSIADKFEYLTKKYVHPENGVRPNLKQLIYVGNDLNDLQIMLKAGLTFCPNDAHPMIKSISSFVSERNGGQDFVREIIEILLGFEQLGIEEINELISNR